MRLLLGLIRRSIFNLLGVSSLLVGVVLLPFGILSTVNNDHFESIAKTTISQTISQVPIANTNHATNIVFTYVVNGHLYKAQQAGPDYTESLPAQKILYNPTNPSDAKLYNQNITNAGETFGLAIFFIALAVIFFFTGWLVRMFRNLIFRRRVGVKL